MLAQRKTQVVLTWVGLLVVASLVSGCCLSGPSIEVTPSEVEMEVDDIVSISATWQCLRGGVTWTATCGSIGACPYRYSFVIGSRIGYTAPEEPGSCTVTATGTARSDVSASTLVTVTAPQGPVSVRIAPMTAALVVNEALPFTAAVTGALDRSVTWDASCGSISGSGNTITYAAPATEGPCALTATSNADPSKSATASVSVTVGSDFEQAPSYITIADVSLAVASGGSRRVSFDISWDESWRDPHRPTWLAASDTWDAAWVFDEACTGDPNIGALDVDVRIRPGWNVLAMCLTGSGQVFWRTGEPDLDVPWLGPFFLFA